jgi:hypothetical protein
MRSSWQPDLCQGHGRPTFLETGMKNLIDSFVQGIGFMAGAGLVYISANIAFYVIYLM